MNKNSDESGKKGAKESGKDNANKSDKKDDDSEEKQVSGKKKLTEVKVRTNVVMKVDWRKMKIEELLFQKWQGWSSGSIVIWAMLIWFHLEL